VSDRRRLAASLLALASSFAAVLILGAASGQAHGVVLRVAAVQLQETPLPWQPATPQPIATPQTSGRLPWQPGTPQPTATPQTSKVPKSSSRASAAALVSDTFSGSQVAVLDVRSLRMIAFGQLDADGTFTTRVTAGSYLVCLSPPNGWKPVSAAVNRIHGWICTAKHVGASTATVKFKLAPTASSATEVTR
jgi:hypothetical protein